MPPPRYSTPDLDRADIVTRDSVHPILLAPRDATTSWCAADGRVAKTRTAPALTRMINLVNTGQPVLVADALNLASTALERDLLAGWRALTITQEPA